jgi:fused signal recognition particle receptor
MFDFFKKTFETSIKKIRETFGFQSDTAQSPESIQENLIKMNFTYDLSKKLTEKIIQSGNWIESLEKELKLIVHSVKECSEKKVILLVGINGSGKTTTSLKLAKKKLSHGQALLVPADTFRAAAREQLITLAKINMIPYLESTATTPTSVVYEASVKDKNNEFANIIIDTAGRIHQNDNLLKELEKTIQVAKKYFGQENCTTYLVLDGLQGKNLFEQTTLFTEKIAIDGIILTKLDAGIKPGIIFSIIEKYHIPITYLSYGQHDTDIVEFDTEYFISTFIE